MTFLTTVETDAKTVIADERAIAKDVGIGPLGLGAAIAGSAGLLLLAHLSLLVSSAPLFGALAYAGYKKVRAAL